MKITDSRASDQVHYCFYHQWWNEVTSNIRANYHCTMTLKQHHCTMNRLIITTQQHRSPVNHQYKGFYTVCAPFEPLY